MTLNDQLVRKTSPLRSFIPFFSRIFRVLTLDRKVFIEVYADPRATLQSFILVLLVNAISQSSRLSLDEFNPFFFLSVILFGTLSWIVGGAIAFIIGRFILPMPGTGLTPPSVTRVFAYTQAPALLMIFGHIPHAGLTLQIVVRLWGLIVGLIAIKQAFAWSLLRSVLGLFIMNIIFLMIELGFYFTLIIA